MHDKGNVTQFLGKKTPPTSHEILVQRATNSGQIKCNKFGFISLS